MSLLEARGEMTLDGPEAEAFIQSQAQGHHDARGRPHARASRTTSARRPSTPTRSSPTASSRKQNGLAGSVMEYNAVNIALQGREAGRVPHVHARPLRLLGDRVRLPASSRRSRKPPSSRSIAGRSKRAAARVHGRRRAVLQRPRSAREHVRPRHRSARVRRAAAEARPRAVAAHGDARAQARRELRAPAPQLQRAACSRCSTARMQAAKYVGGLTLHSDHAGSGRAPLEPIPAAKQRAALNLLATTVLRRRQLPLLAGVPEPACRSPTSTSTTRASRPQRADRRRRRRPAGARRAALGARRRCSGRRSRSACSTTSSR